MQHFLHSSCFYIPLCKFLSDFLLFCFFTGTSFSCVHFWTISSITPILCRSLKAPVWACAFLHLQFLCRTSNLHIKINFLKSKHIWERKFIRNCVNCEVCHCVLPRLHCGHYFDTLKKIHCTSQLNECNLQMVILKSSGSDAEPRKDMTLNGWLAEFKSGVAFNFKGGTSCCL